jgi:hypothetical protein
MGQMVSYEGNVVEVMRSFASVAGACVIVGSGTQ